MFIKRGDCLPITHIITVNDDIDEEEISEALRKAKEDIKNIKRNGNKIESNTVSDK
jgi:F0F1-type ATP synthase epsilon subunit